VHVHVVLVKLTDQNDAERCMTAMRSMQGRIDGLVGLDCRRNEIDTAESFDVRLQTRFTDRAAYDSYRTDPVHTEVATLVRSLMSDAATLDWTEP
jgi:hypothetical protein